MSGDGWNNSKPVIIYDSPNMGRGKLDKALKIYYDKVLKSKEEVKKAGTHLKEIEIKIKRIYKSREISFQLKVNKLEKDRHEHEKGKSEFLERKLIFFKAEKDLKKEKEDFNSYVKEKSKHIHAALKNVYSENECVKEREKLCLLREKSLVTEFTNLNKFKLDVEKKFKDLINKELICEKDKKNLQSLEIELQKTKSNLKLEIISIDKQRKEFQRLNQSLENEIKETEKKRNQILNYEEKLNEKEVNLNKNAANLGDSSVKLNEKSISLSEKERAQRLEKRELVKKKQIIDRLRKEIKP